MHWEINAKGSTVGYTGNAESTPISEAVVELWRKYTEDAASKNDEIAWDHLRIETWLDSGRIILFPTPSPYRHRVEKAVCQVICPDLLASYNEAADSKMTDDEFEAWAAAATEKVVNLVSQASKEARLPERLGRPEVRILYYSYSGEDGPIREDLLKT